MSRDLRRAKGQFESKPGEKFFAKIETTTRTSVHKKLNRFNPKYNASARTLENDYLLSLCE